MVSKYEVVIYWSKNDGVFIAEVPELEGCIAHGESQQEALEAANLVVIEWLQLAKENNWPVPEPKGRLMYA